MSIFKTLLITFCSILFISATAQQPSIKILESGKRISIRGLSVVNDDVIWASGTGGSVALSTDAGNTFTWMKVPGYEKMDFRDIEAFDKNTAIIMGITTPAVILKTIDGGKTWSKVFEDTTKGAFLDAMDFSPNSQHGIVVGDPLDEMHSPYLLYTDDRGDSWKKIRNIENPITLADGEAFFASSGSNLKITENIPWWVLVSGGKSSKAYVLFQQTDKTWKYYTKGDLLPIKQGTESTGANSIAMQKGVGNSYNAVVVGGDFSKDTIASNNCVLFIMHGNLLNIKQPKTFPNGYRSCVIYLNKKTLLTCGTSGVDISNDGGMNWQLIAKDGFHVCQKAKKGKSVFLAGGNGKIAKLVFP
ncbi:MAG: oxidoreductase [Bacteroidota bacterium]